ncbi:MAG: SDR family NAD(P)-dependent oxidoreductase [Mycobacterium sp.]
MQLTGNTVLVTGGGIGRGLAVAFHEAGNRVVIAGRRIEALRAVADEHPGITCLELDQSERHSIERFVDQLRRHTDLNVLVNNAGMIALEDLSDPDPDVASAVISTNLLGPVVLTSLLLPTLRAQRNPAIINVTSALAFVPLAFAPTYSATKAALHAYTESLRIQLHDSGVHVIEIAPPRVETDMEGPADDDFTMSVDDFIAETMSLLASRPDAAEVIVKAARGLREAERDGVYAELFAAVNPNSLAAAGKEVW